MSRVGDGIWLLAISLAFAVFIVWGQRTGEVVVRYPFAIRRETSPRLFYAIQLTFGLAAIVFAIMAVMTLLGYLSI